MGCANHEIYYLKEMELKLLLAGLGLTEWYGLFSVEEDTAGTSAVKTAEKHTNSVLAHMYQNGVIDWEEGQIAVNQPYSAMLSAMLEKRKCVVMQMQGSDAPIRCCYISKAGVVVMQKSQREKDTLGILQLSVLDWFEFVEEQIQMMEDGQSLILSCKNSENGLEYKRVLMQQEGIHTYLVCLENGRQISVPFRQEELRKMLGEQFFT